MRFARAVSRALKKGDHQILLNLPDRVKKLGVRQIYYVEGQNRMLHYYTKEGELVVRGTMQSAQKLLEPYHFVRCNHWYMVNLMHVSEVRKDTVVVAGHELEMSRRNRTAFLAALTNYMGGGA
jgi:DNA-binding LytR/AlgR family response regulator